MNNLSNEDMVALSKALKTKAVSEAVSNMLAGEYKIDAIVRLQGDLKLGEAYTQDFVQLSKPWDLLATALSKLNDETVESIVRESFSVDPKSVTELKSKAKEAIKRLKGTSKKLANGKVTTDLSVTYISKASVSDSNWVTDIALNEGRVSE